MNTLGDTITLSSGASAVRVRIAKATVFLQPPLTIREIGHGEVLVASCWRQPHDRQAVLGMAEDGRHQDEGDIAMKESALKELGAKEDITNDGRTLEISL